MKLSRRKFFGALAAAPIAAKATVTELSKQAIDAKPMALGEMNSGPWLSVPNSGNCSSQLEYWKNELVQVLTDEHRKKQIAEYKHHITRLDPDLAYARSFSMATRLQIQAERMAERLIEERKQGILANILTYTKIENEGKSDGPKSNSL